ncbi:MAG TPA: hypothetical protein VG841_07985 [Caulobacterales bacterium]|nr:hypothetical protein [Caulobacterales bacterium]
MLVIGLIALQLVITLTGLALLWRRVDLLGAELTRLRSGLEERAAVRPEQRKTAAASGAAAALSEWRARVDKEIRAMGRTDAAPEPLAPALRPETAREIAVTCALAAPAIGLAFAAPLPAIVAAALVIAAAVALISLRSAWRDTAWFATIGGGAWALAGLLAGVGGAHTALFCDGLVVAAGAGLLRARLGRPSGPGAALALLMAVAALTAGAQLGLIGSTGVAFGLIVALAAAFGAAALRLEWIHMTAFIGAGAGLFVLSSQPGADVWFTPAAVWAGMWFLALAFVRVPELGPRGLLVAATGTIAPMFAVSALYRARHGLETPYAAAGGFAALALCFAMLLVLAARRQKHLADLHLTLWALGASASGSLATAILLITPAPAYPSVFAVLALGAVALNERWPDRFWSASAAAFALAAAGFGANSAAAFEALNSPWPPVFVALAAFTAPAAIAGAAAHFAKTRAPIAGAILEACAILGAAAALSAWTRLAFSDGAPALQGVSFVESGAHAALWLIAALVLGARARRSGAPVRNTLAVVLTACGAGVSFAALIAWLAPWWGADLTTPAYLHPPLGFAAPAAALWAHWIYWRHTDKPRRARWSFAAASVLTAAAITLELVWRGDFGAAWTPLALGAGAFAIAAGLNFVPGLATRRMNRDRRLPTLTIVPPVPPADAPRKKNAPSVEKTN